MVTKGLKAAEAVYLYVNYAQVYLGNEPFHSMSVVVWEIDAFVVRFREYGVEMIGVIA